MSLGQEVESFLGSVEVVTTHGRGRTPEELAEQAVNRIISVGDKSHPLVTEQAHAFRGEIKKILVQYMHEAIRSEKVTLVNKFTQAGFTELIPLLNE